MKFQKIVAAVPSTVGPAEMGTLDIQCARYPDNSAYSTVVTVPTRYHFTKAGGAAAYRIWLCRKGVRSLAYSLRAARLGPHLNTPDKCLICPRANGGPASIWHLRSSAAAYHSESVS